MNDKLQRVKTLLMHGRELVKDEPLEDIYLMLVIMALQQ